MHIKRPKKFLILFIIPLIYLMCVILNITVFKGDRYTDMAASQRTLETDFKRNVITDRNMIPLTGEEIRYTDDSLARHIIGYTDAFGEGVSGIEKDLNDELSATEKKVRAKLKDAKGNVILSHEPELSFAVVILSSPEMKKGETYTIRVGDISENFAAN